MGELPCVRDKCLKYPVCKATEMIRCDLLTRFFSEKVKPGTTPAMIFEALRCSKQLPMIRTVTVEQRDSNDPYLNYIPYTFGRRHDHDSM